MEPGIWSINLGYVCFICFLAQHRSGLYPQAWNTCCRFFLLLPPLSHCLIIASETFLLPFLGWNTRYIRWYKADSETRSFPAVGWVAFWSPIVGTGDPLPPPNEVTVEEGDGVATSWLLQAGTFGMVVEAGNATGLSGETSYGSHIAATCESSLSLEGLVEWGQPISTWCKPN